MSPDDSRQVELLAFEGEFVRWAMPSKDVHHILEERDWQGDYAPDAAGVAGIAVSATLMPVRVLLLASGARQVPVKVRGPLSLLQVEGRDLLQLPPEFGRTSVATRVAVQGGKPTLVVLDVTRLAAAVTDSVVGSAPLAQSEGSR